MSDRASRRTSLARHELAQVIEIVEAIKPALAGKAPHVIGAALSELVAIWLASHVVRGNPRATNRLRDNLLDGHFETVNKLVPLNAKSLGTEE